MPVFWRYSKLGLCGLLAWIAFSGCQSKNSQLKPAPKFESKVWDRHQAEEEYRLTQTELRLAKSDQVYLVLDFEHKRIELKLKGAIVWDCRIQSDQADDHQLQEFSTRFVGRGERVLLPLADKYLFAAEDKTPDSVLAIVGEATNVNPQLMQREVPARFQLFWNHGLTLEVRTAVKGKPTSGLESALVELRHALRRPFGEAYLFLNMNPDDALTLYRAVKPGMPTLAYPLSE
jgi:hypothetical protein